jgi:hypothetical protein
LSASTFAKPCSAGACAAADPCADGRALLPADDRADDGPAGRRAADFDRVLLLGGLRGALDGCRVDPVTLIVAAHGQRVEAYTDVGEAFHLAGSCGVGDDAAHLRALGQDRLTVQDNRLGDVRVDGFFDAARVGADARLEHDREAGARGKRDLPYDRRRCSWRGGRCAARTS